MQTIPVNIELQIACFRDQPHEQTICEIAETLMRKIRGLHAKPEDHCTPFYVQNCHIKIEGDANRLPPVAASTNIPEHNRWLDL